MTDDKFPLSSAKLKAKYEALSRKTSVIDSSNPSEDKYVNEKAVVDYVNELKDYIGSP